MNRTAIRQGRRGAASLAAVGLWLAAQGTLAALVTVSGTETWDGTANPHAADGVTLVTNAGPVYVYTIPDGMTITESGVINLGQNNVTFTFANGGLHLDAGRYIDADTKSLRYGARTFTLDMGTNSITGNGDIKGTFTPAIGLHSVTITGAGGVSLNSVDIRNAEAQNASLSLHVGGTVSIGSIDVSGPSSGGGSSGNITVRAPQVTVGAVSAYSYKSTPGNIRLDALAYPYFGYQAWATNSHANTLTLNGVVRTKGVSGSGLSGGSVAANGVNMVLGAGFNTNLNVDTTFVLRRGTGGAGHFTDNTGLGLTSEEEVSHVEHPHTDAKPQVIVYTTEVWDGTANPRAADGVALDGVTKTYTLPSELYVTQLGTIDTGNGTTADIALVFTNGGLRMDDGGIVEVSCGRFIAAKLTMELGGYSVLGAGDINGGEGTFSIGTRTIVITNAGDVALDEIWIPTGEAQNGDVRITATGSVSLTTIDTSDWTGGGNSAGNITVRGSEVDVRNAYAYCSRSSSGVSAGNILLEALMPPQFDPTQPINTKDNTLVVRGLLDTRGPAVQNNGNITLRGAIVTLESGFNVDSNGVFAIHAGDAEPHSTYFIDNSSAGPFTAVHNVQLQAPGGTVFVIR